MIDAPILTKLLSEKAVSKVSFFRALETLNKGLTEKKIWNVELNDAKFTLSNAVHLALDIICDRHRSNRTAEFHYEEWMQDFSGYISFNQAAGRIKRLTKNAPKTKVVQDYIEALKEVDAIWKAICELKPLIQKGRRPNQNKTEAQVAEELKNTGVCAICGKRQKMGDADKMVHHGYEMSDYNHSGFRMGSCFGVDFLPYELSNEANVAYAPVLAEQLKGTERALETLPKLEEFEIEESEWNYKTHRSDKKKITVYKTGPTAERFAREFEHRKYRLEREIESLKDDILTNRAKIDSWTLQPLKYGRYGDKKSKEATCTQAKS